MLLALTRVWTRRSFVSRLLMVAGLALLLAGMAVLFLAAYQEANEAHLDMETELAHELRNLPMALLEVLVIDDYASLQQMLDRYIERPRVAQVTFEDEISKKILISRAAPLPNLAPRWFFKGLGFHDLSGTACLVAGGRNYGQVVLTLTAQGVGNRAWQRVLNYTVALLVVVGLDFLGIWWMLYRGFSPLQHLEQGANAIAQGALDTRLPEEGSPELRHLIASFNHMAEAMQESRLRLNAAHSNLTRFAEVSAHHLMEPSRRLISYTQLLRNRVRALPNKLEDEEIYAALDYIELDAARLRHLIRDVQLYLAASEPRGVLQLEEVTAALAALQQRLAPQLAAAQVRLDAGILPPVYLDRPRLLDLLGVLLDNALHHGLPTDPGVLPHFRLIGQRRGNLCRYIWMDNGPGIPAEYRERVFGIFERLPSRHGAGTGIGLSIARRIVESQHGKIWLEGPPQGGCQVIFELPAVSKQE